MKRSLDLKIVTNDKDTRDAIMAVLPGIDDARVWSDQYTPPSEGIDESGDTEVAGSIRFYNDTDRGDIESLVKDVEGMFSLCEPGSYLRLHDCYHDEVTPKPCEITVLYEVVKDETSDLL